MNDTWLVSALIAALAGAPAPISNRVQPMEGGGRYVAEALPVVEGDKQYVLFTFCTVSGGNRPGTERRLYPPFAKAYVAYPDLKVRWQEVDEKKGIANLATLTDADNHRYFGVIKRVGITSSEWTNTRVRYNELLSVVLERKWLLTRHATSAEERATAKELADCVRVVYDKPLLPYYREEGRQFFAWMERAAK